MAKRKSQRVFSDDATGTLKIVLSSIPPQLFSKRQKTGCRLGCFIFSPFFFKLKMHGVSSDQISVTIKETKIVCRFNVV